MSGIRGISEPAYAPEIIAAMREGGESASVERLAERFDVSTHAMRQRLDRMVRMGLLDGPVVGIYRLRRRRGVA